MQQLRETNFSPDASIVLIGMRGVGKTSLGLIASTTLRRTFIDCDSVFQTVVSSEVYYTGIISLH